MISKTSAVMVKENDIEQLFQGTPETRYEGELAIEGRYLVFRGRDVKKGLKLQEIVPLEQIIEISLAFDERLSNNAGPSLGIGGSVPFTVRYQNDKAECTACFNIYLHNSARFNPYLSDYNVAERNLRWYEMLKDTVTLLHVNNRGETEKVNRAYSTIGAR